MSDWSEAVLSYEERNWEELAEAFVVKYSALWNDYAPIDGIFIDIVEGFIEKNEDLWYEFVNDRFFKEGPFEQFGIYED